MFQSQPVTVRELRNIHNNTCKVVHKTNFTGIKYILHTLSVLQHVAAHHTCHHHAVLVDIIIKLSNCLLHVTYHDKPDDGMRGVPKIVGELVTYEEYI